MKRPSDEGPRIRISPASPDRIPTAGGDSNRSRSETRIGESAEAFEDRTLSAIFRITLEEDQRLDAQGQKLIYLPGVRQELEDLEQPVRLSVGILDQAILEAASNAENQKPLTYLLPCWKRVSKLYKGFRKPIPGEPKYAVIKEARRLCISYCIFAATMPEMFGCDLSLLPQKIGRQPTDRSHRSDTPSSLKSHLLLDPEDDQGICQDFLAEAMKCSDEDESVMPVFVGAVEEMSRDLGELSMSQDIKPYLIVR
jgi:ubiquitin conjugation factor E4 B